MPNSSFVFKRKKLEVRAMRDIAKGEDVTVDLADVTKPKAERQEELPEWRGIVCHCVRCQKADQDDSSRRIHSPIILLPVLITKIMVRDFTPFTDRTYTRFSHPIEQEMMVVMQKSDWATWRKLTHTFTQLFGKK